MNGMAASDRVVTTAGAVFVVAAASGDIHPQTLDGLYAHDTRFLSCFSLRLSGHEPMPLGADTFENTVSSFYGRSAAAPGLAEGAISVVRDRMVQQGLHEDISLLNHTAEAVQVRLELRFDADFADVFEIRRISGPAQAEKPGRTIVEALPGRGLRFVYRRRDFQRETHVAFTERAEVRGRSATFDLTLPAGGEWGT